MKNISVEVLKKLLADSFSLYLKTLNYHWNVRETVGFFEIHKLLQEQYESLAEALDLLAERIAITGDYAPASYSEYQKLTSIKEGDYRQSAIKMVEELAKDHLQIYKFIEDNQDKVDFVTNDVIVGRAKEHTKAAWMLNSFLEKK